MKKQNLVLCDTTIVPSYEDYKDWCEMNEVEPQSEDSDDYWRFVYNTQSDEWEDLIMNVRYSKLNFQKWVITGSLGLWYGTRDISPRVSDSLESALRLCCNGDDAIVKKCGSRLKVQVLHHDGRNNFELRALSDLGVERFERRDGQISLSNRENIQRLPEFLF